MLVITTLSFLLPVTLVLALTTLALEQRIENT